MTTAFAKVGFSGDYGGTFFMSQLVGTAKARQLYFLSERVSAQEALDLGLTNWVCEPDELAAKAEEVASQLATGPTVAFRYMKENFARALSSGDLIDRIVGDHASQAVWPNKRSPYATKAFVEKRVPVFNGR